MSKRVGLFIASILICAIVFSQNTNNSCNHWLYLPSRPSHVDIGDLDIPGNTITVEAAFSRTGAYVPGRNSAGDIVSKHTDLRDINYLLRASSAEITTTNGYFNTPPICEIEMNKTYHVAMVYDGSTLKFYRNGYLMSQVAVSGNMIQNDWRTEIGFYQAQVHDEQFIGYINEVRIWKTARSQTDIRKYMNTSLPSPAAQTGLLAYYTFDNLVNKQGNSAWNGTLKGNAVIHQTNPTCQTYSVDSCCTFYTKPVILTMRDTSICPATTTQLQANSGFLSYRWSPAAAVNDPDISNPVASPSQSTLYRVEVRDGINNCTFRDSVKVQIRTNPFAAVPDQTICEGASIGLKASGGDRYLWSPAVSVDDVQSATPVATPKQTTQYSVYISDNTCHRDTTIQVRVTVKDSAGFQVPNAFTPNNDGYNDCISVKKWGNAVMEEFSVYSRWGERLFTTKNPWECWNGQYKGKLMDSGVYTYSIRAKTVCGTIKRTGVITLIR